MRYWDLPRFWGDTVDHLSKTKTQKLGVALRKLIRTSKTRPVTIRHVYRTQVCSNPDKSSRAWGKKILETKRALEKLGWRVEFGGGWSRYQERPAQPRPSRGTAAFYLRATKEITTLDGSEKWCELLEQLRRATTAEAPNVKHCGHT